MGPKGTSERGKEWTTVGGKIPFPPGGVKVRGTDPTCWSVRERDTDGAQVKGNMLGMKKAPS